MNNALPITLTTACILGIMFIWLSARVIAWRVRLQALIGDSDNDEMLFLIRTHANFTEYTPIFLIILGLVEYMGGNATALTVIAVLFVIARLLHVPGMGPEANLKFRQAGIIGSFTTIGAASFYGLYIALM